MTREDMLARLIAQASTEGGDLVTLRAIVEEASELGAHRVLHRLGGVLSKMPRQIVFRCTVNSGCVNPTPRFSPEVLYINRHVNGLHNALLPVDWLSEQK